MRGDDAVLGDSLSMPRGTPPRARGRRVGDRRDHRAQGNTPACAGTTPRECVSRCTRREHPRVRGDDVAPTPDTCVVIGTPPRARGRRGQGAGREVHRGNTPACAGTTSPQPQRLPRTREHPRVRGDDHVRRSLLILLTGTPPRVRGRRMDADALAPRVRNTPACAGTTVGVSPRCSPTGEHPRVRGDDNSLIRTSSRIIGTPPRARGRLDRGEVLAVEVRNTPACAGTTGSSASRRPPPAEHPRVRGDDAARGHTSARTDGTPPRARGRQPRLPQDLPDDRNTPACAGTTPPAPGSSTAEWEHPRVRGDDTPTSMEWRWVLGTPPRARGRHADEHGVAVGAGNTPACAGTTGRSSRPAGR